MMQIHAALYCFKIYQLLLTAYIMILLLLQLGPNKMNPTSCWPAAGSREKLLKMLIQVGMSRCYDDKTFWIEKFFS